MNMYDVSYHGLEVGDRVMCQDGVERMITGSGRVVLFDGRWVEYLIFHDKSALLPFDHMRVGKSLHDFRFAVSRFPEDGVPYVGRYGQSPDETLRLITEGI